MTCHNKEILEKNIVKCRKAENLKILSFDMFEDRPKAST